MTDYPAVRHSHVVPRGYLKAWSKDDKIGMRRVGQQTSRDISTRDAGVRSNFYRRQRPKDGSTIHDVEWSLAQMEQAVLPLADSLVKPWPLTIDDKLKVGEFVATQHVRGPAFKTWYHQTVDQQLADARQEEDLPPPAFAGLEAHLNSDTERLTRMLSLTRSVSTVFASMHWTLVEFSKPVLVTSDHPVIAWPASQKRVRPCANDWGAGVTNALEVFIPVNPNMLLLLTWLDATDPVEPVTGRGAHASTANAFVVANAEAQWFHLPGFQRSFARGPRSRLGAELVPAYSIEAAVGSQRRIKATEEATEMAGQPLSNDPIPVVGVSRPAKT